MHLSATSRLRPLMGWCIGRNRRVDQAMSVILTTDEERETF